MWRHTWTYLEAISGSYVGRLRIIAVLRNFYPNITNGHVGQSHQRYSQSRRGHHYRETWPGSFLSSRRVPRQTCHGRGTNLRPPAPQVDTLPKEPSRQLILYADYSEPLHIYIFFHCGSRIQNSTGSRIQNSTGSRIQKSTGSRISVRDWQHCLIVYKDIGICQDTITNISFSNDGMNLITSSSDDQIIIYDCEKGTERRRLNRLVSTVLIPDFLI